MDRNKARQVSEAVAEAIAEVEEKHGVKLVKRRARFGVSDLKLTLEFGVVTEDGVESRATQDFRAMARNYGFGADDLGEEFLVDGEAYRIVGLNANAPKYPILGERVSDGRTYKFAPATVRIGLTKKIAQRIADENAERAEGVA